MSGWWILLLFVAILERPTIRVESVEIVRPWPFISWAIVVAAIAFVAAIDARGWPS